MEMQNEIESLHRNGTWGLCELSKGHRVLTAKLYKRKECIPGIEDAT